MSHTKPIADQLKDEYPILVHNNFIIQRQNIFKYMKKITNLFKPKKDSLRGIKARELEHLLQGPLHSITVSELVLMCFRCIITTKM